MFPNKTYTSRQLKGCTKCIESSITWNRPSTYIHKYPYVREKKGSSYSFSSLERALFLLSLLSLFSFVVPAPLANNNCLLPRSPSSRNVFFCAQKSVCKYCEQLKVYRMYFVENLYSKSMCLKEASSQIVRCNYTSLPIQSILLFLGSSFFCRPLCLMTEKRGERELRHLGPWGGGEERREREGPPLKEASGVDEEEKKGWGLS